MFVEYTNPYILLISNVFMDIQPEPALKAFIKHNGKILILRESKDYSDGTNVGRYDVPGGRVKFGEGWKDGLLREIKEETGLVVRIGRPFDVAEWRPVKNGVERHVVATFFECFSDSDSVNLSKDHDGREWIYPRDFRNYNIIPNLIPMFESYLTR